MDVLEIPSVRLSVSAGIGRIFPLMSRRSVFFRWVVVGVVVVKVVVGMDDLTTIPS